MGEPAESFRPSSLHLHSVAEVPRRVFARAASEGRAPETGAAALTLYDMVAETLILIENAREGYGPFVKHNPVRQDFPPIMDYLDGGSVEKIDAYFHALSKGEDPPIGVSLKKNNIGARGSDTYPDPGL